MSDSGSVPRGPSELYLQLLKGEITSEDYAKSVRKDLAKGRVGGTRSTATLTGQEATRKSH